MAAWVAPLISAGSSILGGIFGSNAKKREEEARKKENKKLLKDERAYAEQQDQRDFERTTAFNAEQRAHFVADRADDRAYAEAFRADDRAYGETALTRVREQAISAGFNPLTALTLGGSSSASGSSGGAISSGTSSAAPPLASTRVVTQGYQSASDSGPSMGQILAEAGGLLASTLYEIRKNSAPATSMRPVQRPSRQGASPSGGKPGAVRTNGKPASAVSPVARTVAPRLGSPLATAGSGGSVAYPAPNSLWSDPKLLPLHQGNSENARGNNGLLRPERDPSVPMDMEVALYGTATEPPARIGEPTALHATVGRIASNVVGPRISNSWRGIFGLNDPHTGKPVTLNPAVYGWIWGKYSR